MTELGFLTSFRKKFWVLIFVVMADLSENS
jgi:hypothetical protein